MKVIVHQAECVNVNVMFRGANQQIIHSGYEIGIASEHNGIICSRRADVVKRDVHRIQVFRVNLVEVNKCSYET